MSIQTPVDKAGPLWLAWEAYKSTPEYANTRNWALDDHHVDGSLWAAFERGFAASRDTLVSPAPPKCLICKERDGNVLVCAECIVDVSNELLAHPLVSPAPETETVDVQLLAWAITNCHMLARRALARSTSPFDREKWEHVQRICEKAGARSKGVLRASVPTEITDGSEVVAPPPPAVDLPEIDLEIQNLQLQIRMLNAGQERNDYVWQPLLDDLERWRLETNQAIRNIRGMNRRIKRQQREIERLQALAPESNK